MRDRLRAVGLVAELVEIFDDAVDAVLRDAEGFAADAAEGDHFASSDRAVGEDHAKQQQQLRRQHRIVGDLAHAGVAFEQRDDIVEQSLQHASLFDPLAKAYRETRLAQAGCV